MIKHLFGRKKGPPAPPKPDYSGPATICDDDNDEYSYQDPDKWTNTDLTARISTLSSSSSSGRAETGRVYTLTATDTWVEEVPRSGSPASDEGVVVGSPVVTEDYSDPCDAKVGDIPTSPSSTERYLYTEPYDEEQDEVLEVYDEPYESVEAGGEGHVIQQQFADMERLRLTAPVDDRPLDDYDAPWEWKTKALELRLQQSQSGVGMGVEQEAEAVSSQSEVPSKVEGEVVVIEEDLDTESSEDEGKTLPGYVNIGIKEDRQSKTVEHLYVNIHGSSTKDKITGDDLVIPTQNEFSAHFHDTLRRDTPPVEEELANYEDPWDLGQKQEELESKIRQAQKSKQNQPRSESGLVVPPGMAIPKPPGMAIPSQPGLAVPNPPGMAIPKSIPQSSRIEARESPPVRNSQVEGVSSKSFVFHSHDDGHRSSRVPKEAQQKSEVTRRGPTGMGSPDVSRQSKVSSQADDRPQEEYEAPWDLKAKKLQMSSGSFDMTHESVTARSRPESSASHMSWSTSSPTHSGRQDSSRRKERPTPFKLGCQAQNAVGERVDPGIPLSEQSWYHGAITRGDAEALLRVHCEGSYLVRQSESNKTDFSLSLKGAAGFIHMKVLFRANKYILGQASQPFDTIPQMIHHYTINKLNIKGADHMLLLHPIIYEML